MEARYSAWQENFSFCSYIADALKMSGENKVPSVRWIDIVTEKPDSGKDAQTIIQEVSAKAGIKITKGGE